MTKLEMLHGKILKEQKRIDMLKNTKSNGITDWYDFVGSEIKEAKAKIAELKIDFDLEYQHNNNNH